jgi:hypothetical protein
MRVSRGQAGTGQCQSAHFLLGERALASKLAGRPAGAEDAAGDVTTNYPVNVLVKQTPKGIVNLLIPRPPALEEDHQ